MSIFADYGVQAAYHYSPLHYLPFIARSRSLLSKPTLRTRGFGAHHLRSMSNTQDIERGFGQYTHLTLDSAPRILKAKLAAGFPHVAIAVPEGTFDNVEFSLCRYNVAMTRQLRRGNKRGFPESPTNGRYYECHQIPIARTDTDKRAMLEHHLPKGTMIEILVHGDLALPNDTTILTFCDSDAEITDEVLSEVDSPWSCRKIDAPTTYTPNPIHDQSVRTFVAHALADANWQGDGLEFDRV